MWYLIVSIPDLCTLTYFHYLACNDRNAFFTSENSKKHHAWSCQNVCDALIFLLDNIIRFGTKLYRQVVGIPVGTNCAPQVSDFIPVLLREGLYDVSF